MNLDNVTNFVARNCSFSDNKGFDLFQIENAIDNVVVKNCQFSRNDADGFMFKFDEGANGLYVNDCEFNDNRWVDFSNSKLLPWQNHNRFGDNVKQEYSWKRGRGS